MTFLMVNPFYLLAIACICEFFIVFLFIWRSTGPIHRSLIYKHPVLLNLGTTFSFLTYYSIIISIVGYFQGWYVLTLQYLIPLILCSFIAANYLWGSMFILPTKRTIVVHSLTFTVCLVLVFILFPIYSNYYLVFGLGAPLIVLPILSPLFRIVPALRGNTPIYDKSARFFQVNTLTTHIILFLVVSIELYLQYRGYSLILW